MKRRTFETVQARNAAMHCVRDVRALGVELSREAILAYWSAVDRAYRQGAYRWLDRCRYAHARAAWDAGAVGA